MKNVPAILIILVACTCFAPSVSAGSFKLIGQGDIQGGGVVREYGPEGQEILVAWTDKDGNAIGFTEAKTIGEKGFVEFKAPRATNIGVVADFQQFGRIQNAGEISILDVVAFAASGDDFLVTPFPDFIRVTLGTGVELVIPDLYGDTDGSGDLGDGDILYSAVNLAEYVSPGIPGFDLGDSFSIVDGISANLPGFVFSTAPIVRDPNSPNGFRNDSPYTGTGFVLSVHGVSTIPEPSALSIIAIGALLLGLAKRTVGPGPAP